MFRKIRNFFIYKRIIKENLPSLTSRYRLKYNPFSGKLGTIYNLPEENHETAKKYGYRYLDEQVIKYLDSLQNYFFNIGLGELISVRKIDALDAVNVKIEFRYRYHWVVVFLYSVSTLSVIVLSGVLIGGLVKLIAFLIGLIF